MQKRNGESLSAGQANAQAAPLNGQLMPPPNVLASRVHSAARSSETPLPSPEPPVRDDVGPLVGRNFGGYEIVSYIGDGPSGAVYRGEDLLGHAMAVKVLHTGLANRERTETLRDELMRLSSLNEPVLQNIYDTGYGEEDQFFYATDELIGCDLDTALEDSGGLVPSKSYEIIRAVCHALELAHREGVVHGGLRPRNVFLVPAERGTAVKVLDFGAARLGGGSDQGILAGLPPYLAPEQIGRAGATARDVVATPKSDLYALGVLMHELFASTLPAFHGGARAALDGRRGPAGPPTNVEPALAKIILSLLESRPERAPSVGDRSAGSARRVVVGLARARSRAARRGATPRPDDAERLDRAGLDRAHVEVRRARARAGHPPRPLADPSGRAGAGSRLLPRRSEIRKRRTSHGWMRRCTICKRPMRRERP